MSCRVTWFGPVADIEVMFCGMPPGLPPAQFANSAVIMCSQKSTSAALTVSPLDHFQPFMLMTMVLPPFVYTGALAVERP